MDLLVSLMTEAEQVEVVELHNEMATVEFESNRLKTSRIEETRGLAVRLVRHGRLGFAASTDSDALNRLASNAMESASYGEKIPIRFAAPQAAAPVRTFDSQLAALPVAELVEIGREMVDMLVTCEPAARINITLSRGLQKTRLRTHAGTDISFDRSPLTISVDLSRVQENDVLILFELFGITIRGDDLLTPARCIREKLERSKRRATILSGNMPVLFSPTGALALWLPVLEGLNGQNVYKGTSPIACKLGEKLFDSKLTVMDNATLDGRLASAPYDDEGIPHRCNTLIEQGVLKGFLYDLKTAAQSGVQTTGNGTRELFKPPSVSPTNFVVAPGDVPVEEIIRGIDQGLLVEDVLGLGMGNILSGAFSNPLALAFKIEKGEITGRVKDVSIAGNVYDLLANVAAVSTETRWAYNMLSAPYLLVPEMNVVGRD